MATFSPRMIKKDFRVLECLVRESEAQVVISSMLPVEGSDIGRNRWAESIITWLCG